MAPVVSNERRLVLRILDYWKFLRGERRFPAPDDIGPAVLPEDWRDCILVDMSGPPQAWEFRHVGECIRSHSIQLPPSADESPLEPRRRV